MKRLIKLKKDILGKLNINILKRLLQTVSAVLVLLLVFSIVAAQAEERKGVIKTRGGIQDVQDEIGGLSKGNKKAEFKEVEGKVAFIEKDMITIEYYQSRGIAKDVLIPIDQETALKRIRSIDDIQTGAIVNVLYKEIYSKDKEGKKINFKRIATEISLIKSAVLSIE